MSRNFTFSSKSYERLDGVRQQMVAVACRALEVSDVDFAVTCGKRSLEEQERLVEEGKSQTLKSLHLLGNAIDIVPYALGSYQADSWPWYYPVADAFRIASLDLNIPITWGGAWGVDLYDYKSAQAAQMSYMRFKDQVFGNSGMAKCFFDGPHFQLSTEVYQPDFSALFPQET